MALLEFIGEVIGESIIQIIIRLPYFLYKWTVGQHKINGYKTEYKRYIKFEVARKYLVIEGPSQKELETKLKTDLVALHEPHHLNTFHTSTEKGITIISPPNSISFHSFHSPIRSLSQYSTRVVGVVETTRTVYTTYKDPKSTKLIGKTEDGKRFFISLTEDYSKKQFLRINMRLETLDRFDIQNLVSELNSR